MFPHDFVYCRWRGGLAGVGSDQSGGDRVDPSPRDHWLQHVLQKKSKWIKIDGLPCATWMILERWIFIKRRALRSRSSPRSLPIWRRTLVGIGDHTIGRSEPFVHLRRYRTVARTRGRTPRSRSDRTAIAARSSRDRGAFAAESTPQGPDVIFVRMCSEIDAQSTHDQATIVVDPGEKRGPEETEFMAKLRSIRGQSRSGNVAPRNCSHYLSNRLHDRLQLATIFGAISSLKTHVFLLLFFNFWSTREEIKRVSRKVLSSRDPLLPRV